MTGNGSEERPPNATARGRLVMLGLLLTFLGILGLARLLPSVPGALAGALPYAVLALLGLWLGGLFLGLGRRPRSPRRPPVT